jgi:hypothetical protein
MNHTLSDRHMRVSVALPGAIGTYRGTRFSWAGIIAEVTWGDHHLFGSWQDTVCGTAGEFGMGMADNVSPPLGFNAAAPGDCFVNIGVGVLRRPDKEQCKFAKNDELIEAPAWEVTGDNRRVEMRQRLTVDGYGYDDPHTIELILGASTFAPRHRLTNTGDRARAQAHSCHTFMILDRQPVGPDAEVIMPFTPAPALGEDGDVVLEGKRYGFRRLVQKPAFAMLAGFAGTVADNRFTISNRRTGLTVHAAGDRPIICYHMSVDPVAVCPECVVETNAAPGETVAWEHRYELTHEGIQP